MVDIPIPSNDRSISYTAVGGETSFATDFPVFDQADITVIRTRSAVVSTLVLTTDYTVSISASTGYATITPTGSVLAADTWRLKGSIVAARTSDLAARPNADTMADLNEDLDRIWIAVQEFARDLAAAQISPASVPVSTLNGGTGSSYATAKLLREGLGIAGLADSNAFTAAQSIALPTTGAALTVASTDATAIGAPDLVLDRNSASPATNDILGRLFFRGRDSGANATDYVYLLPLILDPINGSEDGALQIRTLVAGVDTLIATFGPGLLMGSATGGDTGPGTINLDNALFRDGTQVVGPRVTGWAAATNTKSKATFDTTTVTLPNLAARVGQLIDDLIAHGLIGT